MPAAARANQTDAVNTIHGTCASPSTIRTGVTGSPNVFINNEPALRYEDTNTPHVGQTPGHAGCSTPVPTKVTGDVAPRVFINNKPAAMMWSTYQCGAAIVSGSSDVYFHEGPGEVTIREMFASVPPTSTPIMTAVHYNDDEAATPESRTFLRRAQISSNENPDSTVQQTPGQTDDTPGNATEVGTDRDCSDIDSHVGPFDGSFKLSPNFTLAQLTTNTLVSNYSLKAQGGLTEKAIVCNLRTLCYGVLEPMKARYGNTMRINSGFRHGSGKSQHERGEAVDISFTDVVSMGDSFQRAVEIKDTYLYDQFIYEQNRTVWFHLSRTSVNNRRQVLTKPRGDQFLAGLTSFDVA